MWMITTVFREGVLKRNAAARVRGGDSLLGKGSTLGRTSLNDAKKTAVVTVVTTADANDQMGKPNLQVSLRDNSALDTPIECLRIPSKQNSNPRKNKPVVSMNPSRFGSSSNNKAEITLELTRIANVAIRDVTSVLLLFLLFRTCTYNTTTTRQYLCQFFTPKPKENLKPNPHQLLIQEEKFQALEDPTGRADHFIYRIDIVDSWCDKFPIENNSLSGNPTPSSNSMVESPSPSPIPYKDSDSLMEETGTFLSHFSDSSPDYETICFDIKEKSSGSTTSHSDYSLPDYDAFYFDDNHIEEKSSGSTTTYLDFSLPEYDSFIFDLSIDPFPPADRNAFYHEEFTDELTHIISLPDYDYFYFDLEADPGEFTRGLKENIFDLSTKSLTINELNDSSLRLSDCDSSLSKEFSEIDILVSFPSGNEDIIFDPGIFIIKGVQSERFHILPLDDFSIFSFVSNSLLLTDPPKIETFLSFPSENEDKVFDPRILLNNRIFSFTRKSPHLQIDNFMIDKCHILSEISLKIVSAISFHLKDKEIQRESS
ncbi:hypothetical protein Tco_1038209 [Tanacetum coccineum]